MIVPTTDAAQSCRFDVRQFRRVVAAGVFDDREVELVAGEFSP